MTRSRTFRGLGLGLAGLAACACLVLGGLLVTRRLPALLVRPDPQRASYEQLKRASEVLPELSFQEGFPRGALVRVHASGATPAERARDYLDRFAGLYLQSDPNLSLALKRTAGETGEEVIFYQTYRGLPVFAGEILVSLDGEYVTATAGGLLPAGVDLDVTPALAASDAESFARAALGLEPDQARLTTPSTLMVFDPGLTQGGPTEAHLAWRVILGGIAPTEIFIDAHEGVPLLQVALSESHTGPFDIDLEDAHYTKASDTYCFTFPDTAEEVGSEEGVYGFAQGDGEAINAWNKGLQTWLFYHDTFGLHSYDNDGEPMDVYIHSTTTGTASYDPSCDLFQFNDGAVTTDVFAHEFAHAIINTTSGLVYSNQPGALNESFADIMGVRSDGNWTVGENLPGGTIRSFSSPPAFGQPDRMSEYVFTSSDNGGVHTNSGIQNYVAYLLGAGGTHPDTGVTIYPIGITHAANLAFLTMNSLPSGAQFIDSRVQWVNLAATYLGVQSACQVRNAWYAVGVGNPDINCDGAEDNPDIDGDGVPFGQDNCVYQFNPTQEDDDGDGMGAACDWDDNGNNIPDYMEKVCPGGKIVPSFLPCDPTDVDEDGVKNDVDNCPEIANPGQEDVDNDGDGDACDPDSDGDGLSDDDDNCPWTPNPDQANADGDFAGDACDPTPDCNDVNAWSAGYQFGDIDIPPKPIPNGNCDPDVRVAGKAWQAIMLQQGSADNPLPVGWNPGDAPTFLPLPGCPPGGDPSPDLRSMLTLKGLDPGVRAWIVDDQGRVLAKKRGPDAALVYSEQGGEAYYLSLYLPAVQGAGQARISEMSFQVGFNCVPVEFLTTAPPELSQTPTPTSTLTPLPTSTVPPSETAGQCTFIAAVNLFCRLGPGQGYEQGDSFTPGQSAPIMGESADGLFWYVLGPNFGRICTVPRAPQFGSTSGECGGLPVFTPMPLPTPTLTPTLTETPTPCAAGVACP